MAKEENVGKPGKALDAKPVDGKQSASDFKAKWDKLKETGAECTVSIPGSNRSVKFSEVRVEGNVLSIWTSTDNTLSPDFVIVNPPSGDDALTETAITIDGATQ